MVCFLAVDNTIYLEDEASSLLTIQLKFIIPVWNAGWRVHFLAISSDQKSSLLTSFPRKKMSRCQFLVYLCYEKRGIQSGQTFSVLYTYHAHFIHLLSCRNLDRMWHTQQPQTWVTTWHCTCSYLTWLGKQKGCKNPSWSAVDTCMLTMLKHLPLPAHSARRNPALINMARVPHTVL